MKPSMRSRPFAVTYPISCSLGLGMRCPPRLTRGERDLAPLRPPRPSVLGPLLSPRLRTLRTPRGKAGGESRVRASAGVDQQAVQGLVESRVP